MICGGAVHLDVTHIPHAVRFYVETLGMKLVEEHDHTSATLDAGEGFRLTLLGVRKPPGASRPTLTLYTKAALADCAAVLENRGIEFQRDSASTLRFSDPDGNVLLLAERA
jgi:catechol 2,3-dioxygenase-like lactoylglutathione lyase family enzyme